MSKRRVKLTTTLSVDKAHILQGVSDRWDGVRTHWNECWRVHPLCRMRGVEELLNRASHALDELRTIVKEMDAELRGRRK